VEGKLKRRGQWVEVAPGDWTVPETGAMLQITNGNKKVSWGMRGEPSNLDFRHFDFETEDEAHEFAWELMGEEK